MNMFNFFKFSITVIVNPDHYTSLFVNFVTNSEQTNILSSPYLLYFFLMTSYTTFELFYNKYLIVKLEMLAALTGKYFM